jgi:hypothetical protein
MRERLVTLVLALCALAAFYGLWLRPGPSLDPDEEVSRPTTAERRGNGYAALFEWLQRSGVKVHSLRERYTELSERGPPARGNLLILTLPGVEVFRSEEFRALDQWVRRGNTLLIIAALVDQPNWAVRRASGAVVEIESLTGIEFESADARKRRLDDTPLADRVREDDEQEARREAGDESDDAVLPADADSPEEVARAAAEEHRDEVFEEARKIALNASGPHALLRDVRTLALESDYAPLEWSIRIPYDSFLLTLARSASGEGVLFEQRVGDGTVLLSAGGSLFTNRALGEADNARLFANIVRTRLAANGSVLFDDLRQGLSASYDPARFYRDPRLYKTLAILLALWLVWVLGSTRLRAPAIVRHDPSEADLVRRAGGLIARTVAPHRTALRLFDHFFAGVARASRRAPESAADREQLWHWLERHAAILPQELDQLKTWYADAHAERAPPLPALQNFLDTLGRRIHT